jgi:AcrR family transcriptional regulator
MIAAAAGVTSSTIYRRWGDIGQVFADVALERLRPEASPRETGSVRGDLIAWAQEYLEEMSTPVGRAALRDIVTGDGLAGPDDDTNQSKYARFCWIAIETILERDTQHLFAADAGEQVIDYVVAPIVYRILFDLERPDPACVVALVDRTLEASRLR